jgi:hypothetical protein
LKTVVRLQARPIAARSRYRIGWAAAIETPIVS